MNWRFLLIETGKKFVLVLVCFPRDDGSLFLCRMVKMPWHWYALYDTISSVEGANVSMLVIIQALINFVSFDVLNVYWFSKMVKGAVKLAKRHSTAAK